MLQGFILGISKGNIICNDTLMVMGKAQCHEEEK